jgi:hypothetical protein
MEKIKKIAKYALNILAFTNALLLGLSIYWGWEIEAITGSITVITGVISTYLLGQKAVSSPAPEITEEDYDNIKG